MLLLSLYFSSPCHELLAWQRSAPLMRYVRSLARECYHSYTFWPHFASNSKVRKFQNCFY